MFLQLKNKLLLFSLKLLVFLFIVALGDFLVGGLLKHFYFSQKSGLLYRTTYSMDSTNAEMLVFGSSRANHHYVPEIFEGELDVSFYNTGRDGNFILYNYAIFKTILDRYNPKIVIFDINPSELNYSITSYDRLSNLLPYISQNNSITEIIQYRSPFEKIKLLSSIYPYNSLLTTIFIGNLTVNKSRKADVKGYVPIFKQKSDIQPKVFDTLLCNLDTLKINCLEKVLRLCRQHDVQLIFVQSPSLISYTYNVAEKYLQSFIAQNKGIYLNYNNDSFFLSNPRYFADASHLNDSGARRFSELLVEQLYPIIYPTIKDHVKKIGTID